jgi:hypothetical protein
MALTRENILTRICLQYEIRKNFLTDMKFPVLQYNMLEKNIWNYFQLNATLCDEVSSVEVKIAHYKEERRFLLRRVLQHEMLQSARRAQPTPATSQTTMLKKFVSSLQPVGK